MFSDIARHGSDREREETVESFEGGGIVEGQGHAQEQEDDLVLSGSQAIAKLAVGRAQECGVVKKGCAASFFWSPDTGQSQHDWNRGGLPDKDIFSR